MNKKKTERRPNGSQTRPQKGLSKQELARLIPLAIKGDQIALKQILTAYKGLVGWKLRGKLCQDATEADIKELTNDVFLKMIGSLPNLRRTLCFKFWLMKIADNVANSHLRRLVRHRKNGKLPERDAEVAIDHQLNQDEKGKCFQVCQQRFADQHDALIQRINEERAASKSLSELDDPLKRHALIEESDEERDARKLLSKLDDRLLRQVFKGIPSQYRVVFWDAIVNGLSHDEIAKKHGWASSTVSRQKLHQAMKAIAELPLPVVTVEIDEQGHARAFNWDRTPLDPGHPFASL